MKGAGLFINYACQSIHKKGAFYVALSGGSTPKALYCLLSGDNYKKKIDWKNVHFFWGDERTVCQDHAQSNYGMANEVLLKKLDLPQSNIHRIEGEKGEKAAHIYSLELTEIIKHKNNDVPIFDLIILGMGSDGHTASLFPGTKTLFEMDKLVDYLYVEKLDSYRITITPPLIKTASNILILVSGKEKAHILKEVQEEKTLLNKYPVSIANECEGNVVWLIDKAASE